MWFSVCSIAPKARSKVLRRSSGAESDAALALEYRPRFVSTSSCSLKAMVHKLNQYRVVSDDVAMPFGDGQLTFSDKKTALKELPSNNMSIPPGSSPLLKHKVVSPDSLKVGGTKRPRPHCPMSPYPSLGETGTNGQLVYASRTLENELVDSPVLRKVGSDVAKEQNAHQKQIDQPKVVSFPVAVSPAALSRVSLRPNSLGRPIYELPVSEPLDATAYSGTALLADLQRPISQDWKQRYIRLQMFLKNCDQSSQEDYVRMIRSLSSIDRSQHAVELEKRAVHLLLEEGKELLRMKVLNVFGKNLNDPSSSTTQFPSLSASVAATSIGKMQPP